jgi:hypothetical protein
MFRTEYKMQFEDLRLALHENHCRPASLREGLTFGIAKPDLHACYTILVPGSFWRSRTGYAFRFILELFSISGERHLYLRQLDMTLEAGAYVLGTYWRR